jgi:ferredoxin
LNELIPMKTSLFVAAPGDSVEVAGERMLQFCQEFVGRLTRQYPGVKSIRLEIEEPAPRPEAPGVFEAAATLKAMVPANISTLGRAPGLESWRYNVRTAFRRTSEDMLDSYYRSAAFVAFTNVYDPAAEGTATAVAEAPKEQIAIVATVAGKKHEITMGKGDNLLDGCIDGKTGIKFQCKSGVCDSCKVRVISGMEFLPPVNDNEKEQLGDLITQGWRLSCQVTAEGPVVIEQP